MSQPASNVAVLLPVCRKDNPDWFLLALESVLSQTFTDFSIYVLCDGALSDALTASLRRSAAADRRIRVLQFKENRGLPFVLNDGLKVGISESMNIFFRMDADDIALPERFERQICYLDAHPEVDVLGCAVAEIDEWGNSRNKIIRYPLSCADCRRFFSRRDPLAHPAVVFRKRFFDKAGYYSEKHLSNQDTYLWFSGFLKHAEFANLNEPLLQFRVTASTFKSRRAGLARAKQMLRDRKHINKTLGYGLAADVHACLFFVLTIMPPFLKRIAYRIFR